MIMSGLPLVIFSTISHKKVLRVLPLFTLALEDKKKEKRSNIDHLKAHNAIRKLHVDFCGCKLANAMNGAIFQFLSKE